MLLKLSPMLELYVMETGSFLEFSQEVSTKIKTAHESWLNFTHILF